MHPRATVAIIVASCAPIPTPAPRAPPDPAALTARYRAARLDQVQLRHQVETRFGARSSIVEGFLVLDRPDRFWVRAKSPLGVTLFDVQDLGAGDLRFDLRLDEVRDSRAPEYLARDIRRIYLCTCATGEVAATPGGATIHCTLPAGGAIIATDDGPDPPDDAVTLRLDAAAHLTEKQFFRAGKPTARVSYGDYRDFAGHPIATHVELHHPEVGYALTIELLAADVDFDAAAVLDRAAATPPSPRSPASK